MPEGLESISFKPQGNTYTQKAIIIFRPSDSLSYKKHKYSVTVVNFTQLHLLFNKQVEIPTLYLSFFVPVQTNHLS